MGHSSIETPSYLGFAYPRDYSLSHRKGSEYALIWTSSTQQQLNTEINVAVENNHTIVLVFTYSKWF